MDAHPAPLSPNYSTITYSPQTRSRAERAIRCAPFRLKLLQDLRDQSVALQDIANDTGIYKGYLRQPVSELVAESALLWLITVGLLRREVDGQGLTDSFRLTPLGRQLLDQWGHQGIQDLKPRLQDHLYNAWSRWLRWPEWLQ
ncbi:MAG: hypothetical protein O2890_12420 [Cyanobacteria bacterium]|nr:hypothetical protein [Cyanobacteriota bacterium]MDA0867195.1 hypothetical protein [Cyanobacteriota bacterium]